MISPQPMQADGLANGLQQAVPTQVGEPAYLTHIQFTHSMSVEWNKNTMKHKRNEQRNGKWRTHSHIQMGMLADHWLLFWHEIVRSPISSKPNWHSKRSTSPLEKPPPSLNPYSGVPGSPQLSLSISDDRERKREREKERERGSEREREKDGERGEIFLWNSAITPEYGQ